MSRSPCELRKQWLEHAESVGLVRAKKGGETRQPSRRMPPSDDMGSDEPCSPSESVEVEPQQDAVQGDEAEQLQKDDSPAESDDEEPDAPQPRSGRGMRAPAGSDPPLTPRIRSCSAAAIEWGRESLDSESVGRAVRARGCAALRCTGVTAYVTS